MRGAQPDSHYLLKARHAEEQAEKWSHDPTIREMWLDIARGFYDLAGFWDPAMGGGRGNSGSPSGATA